MNNHVVATCHAYSRAQANARDNVVKRRKKRGQQAKQAQDSAPTDASASQASADVVEYAGNASTRLPDPRDPSSPLQLDADFDWIADTGATSHMTPHRHWVRNYVPCRIPVKLADHSIVYAVGMGTTVFQPVVDGRASRPVELSRVLHVASEQSAVLFVPYPGQGFQYTHFVFATSLHSCWFMSIHRLHPSQHCSLCGSSLCRFHCSCHP